MRLSARHQVAAFPPMRRRQRRSISVIPNSVLCGEELYVKPTHKRSRSLATSSEMIDAAFRFISKSSTSLMDSTQTDFSADNAGALDEQRIALQPRYYKQRSSIDFDFEEDELSIVDDFSCRFSLESADEEVDVNSDWCPTTPKSCHLSCEVMDWSPPALLKPSYVFLDISSAVDRDLFLPDSF